MSFDYGMMGAGLGAAGAALAAGIGISRIAAASVESIARQPEAAGDIKFSMILTAALIEGVALFGVLVCFLMQSGILAFANANPGG